MVKQYSVWCHKEDCKFRSNEEPHTCNKNGAYLTVLNDGCRCMNYRKIKQDSIPSKIEKLREEALLTKNNDQRYALGIEKAIAVIESKK